MSPKFKKDLERLFIGEKNELDIQGSQTIILNIKVPWNENPNMASTRMSKSLEKSDGRSSTDKKGIDNASSYV